MRIIKLLITTALLFLSFSSFADNRCRASADCTFLTVHNNTGAPLMVFSLIPQTQFLPMLGSWRDGAFYKNYGYITAVDTSDTFYIGDKMSEIQMGVSALAMTTFQSTPCLVTTTMIKLFGVSVENMHMGDGNCTMKETKRSDGVAVDVTINKN